MRFVHRVNTNVYRLLTFLTPLKNSIMKNPHLTLKLNRMMADELNEKKDLISCIVDYYSKKEPKTPKFDLICKFMELSINELSQILEDILNKKGSILLLNINLN